MLSPMPSELRFVKWVRFFWAKLYYKMSDLFWLWDFLLEDLKLKKLRWWHVWTNIRKSYVRNNIFKKKNSKDEIFNDFGPNFVFWGTALGCLSFWFFFHFLSLANHKGQHIYSPPFPPTTTIKNLPTALPRMDQVKLGLLKTYPVTSSFLEPIFHKFYLVHSWIPWPI